MLMGRVLRAKEEGVSGAEISSRAEEECWGMLS